jgi:hypothetical protein
VELRKEGAKIKSAAGSGVESAQTWVLSAASRIGAFGYPGSGFALLPQALLSLVIKRVGATKFGDHFGAG